MLDRAESSTCRALPRRRRRRLGRSRPDAGTEPSFAAAVTPTPDLRLAGHDADSHRRLGGRTRFPGCPSGRWRHSRPTAPTVRREGFAVGVGFGPFVSPATPPTTAPAQSAGPGTRDRRRGRRGRGIRVHQRVRLSEERARSRHVLLVRAEITPGESGLGSLVGGNRLRDVLSCHLGQGAALRTRSLPLRSRARRRRTEDPGEGAAERRLHRDVLPVDDDHVDELREGGLRRRHVQRSHVDERVRDPQDLHRAERPVEPLLSRSVIALEIVGLALMSALASAGP